MPNRYIQAREYWCFISYRHADNKQEGRQWASWLHHSLETYEVPQDLVGQTNARGDIIPERIYPVFRDEEELPADAELSEPIKQAVACSKFMVVSSTARAVNREGFAVQPPAQTTGRLPYAVAIATGTAAELWRVLTA